MADFTVKKYIDEPGQYVLQANTHKAKKLAVALTGQLADPIFDVDGLDELLTTLQAMKYTVHDSRVTS